MDKWDKKEVGFDALIPMIQEWIKGEAKEKPTLHHLNLNLTSDELQRVSEALNKK